MDKPTIPQIANPFREIDCDSRRIYLNRRAIAYFEQDAHDSNATAVVLIGTGERLIVRTHVKSFWDQFDGMDE